MAINMNELVTIKLGTEDIEIYLGNDEMYSDSEPVVVEDNEQL